MNTQAMRIFVCLIPVILIVVLILTTVLFVKRKEIIEKYNVGYISSFCFAAYMFAPLTIGIPMLIFMQEEEKFAILPLLLIYPIVGMIVFMIVYRNKPINYRIGKFFAMLGIGWCASFILVLKMLKFFHNFEKEAPKQRENFETTYKRL